MSNKNKMNNEKYWVYDDYFIFKPEFDEPIEKYVGIISDYSKLIFSDYNDCEITIKIINNPIFRFNYSNNIIFNTSIWHKFRYKWIMSI